MHSDEGRRSFRSWKAREIEAGVRDAAEKEVDGDQEEQGDETTAEAPPVAPHSEETDEELRARYFGDVEEALFRAGM
jgi:hypothetical protein